ncbi:MAG: hypothetical protein K0B11_22135 [Mariniphaga sp.]|nr:hypothetical protein [Mariniphaga sp.]
MTYEKDKIYLDTIDNIVDKVYEFYNMSDRKDLVMIYEMKENKIYSYIYGEYKKDLNELSREILEKQYQEANESKRIVLFIRDEVRKKFKSYVV